MLFNKLVHRDISCIKLLDTYDKFLLRYKHLLLGIYGKVSSLHPCIISSNLKLSPGPETMYNVCTPYIITINTHLKTNTPLNNCITNKDQYFSQLNNSVNNSTGELTNQHLDTFPHNPLVHTYNSLKSVKGNNIIDNERIYCRAECKVTNFNLYKILGLTNSNNDCYFNSIMHVLFGLNFKLRMEQWQANSASLYIGQASCLLILISILYCGCSNKFNLVSDFKSSLAKHNNMFCSTDQQDCQEALIIYVIF